MSDHSFFQSKHNKNNLPKNYSFKTLKIMSTDPEFADEPWLNAQIHIRDTGMLTSIESNYASPTMLKDIEQGKKDMEVVEKVVAIIAHAATANDGDVTILLKDPSGMLPGMIRKEACTEEIRPASVILLNKVQVIKRNGCCYLNIMVENIEATWSKETYPPNEETTAYLGGYVEDTEDVMEPSDYQPDSDETYDEEFEKAKEKAEGSKRTRGLFRRF